MARVFHFRWRQASRQLPLSVKQQLAGIAIHKQFF
jgi:hypothetical protein